MRSRLSGTKRADGRWQIIITLTDENGGKHRQTIYGETQRECQDEALRIKKVGLVKRSPLIEVIWFDFIASHVDRLAPKTQAYYKWTGTRILDRFGKQTPAAVKPNDVRIWMENLAIQGVKGRSIQMHRNCLRVFFGWCRERGLIPSDNPAVGVKLPLKTTPQARPPLTKGEARLIRIHEPDQVQRLYWRLLEETGMRPSEALQTHGEDLRFEKGGIAILKVRGTKTEMADREIPVTAALADLLPRSGRIFTRDIHRTEKLWKAALERAGLKHTNLYQLRKLALSEWARLGVPPDVLKSWAGHSDIAMTHNVYVRVAQRDVSKALRSIGMSSKYVNPLQRGNRSNPSLPVR